MGKYRTLGTLFNRVFRNDLNANFGDVEAEQAAQKARVDNLIANAPQPSEVVDARGTAPVLRDRLDGVDAQLADVANVTISQSYSMESKPIPKPYDDSKLISYLEGVAKKTYSTVALTSTGITKAASGNRNVRVSPTLASYIYSDKHLKFTDGYPLNSKAVISHEIATVNTGNHINGATVSLNDQFSIFLKDIKLGFSSVDSYGTKYLANIFNADTEIRLTLDKAKNGLNMEVRKNGSYLANKELPLTFVSGDSLNILITQDESLEITVCINKDKAKIYSGKIAQTIAKNDYTLVPLDYQTSNLNLQATSSYDSIMVFSKKFNENKAIVTMKDYANHTIVTRQQILSGTGVATDWNEKIAGEVSNILHDPLDTERPYKIAVGGFNGTYSESLTGKTGFAYSKNLITWTYENNGNYCIDRYTEDGCLIKFRGKYYYYAEAMPNRNIHLYTSQDFINWEYEGIVASPDLDPTLASQSSNLVATGSPSAIVKNGEVYLFVEYGYTSNSAHSNKVLVSKDGINFRKLSTVPDLFKREFARPVLDSTQWLINNLEGLCEVDGVYYGWLSITNKTAPPNQFSMWEVKSTDLITWNYTGANFLSTGDFITFACLNNQVLVNGVYNTNNATELLFLSREEQSLPDDFKGANPNLINDPEFKDIKTVLSNNVWYKTKDLPIVVSNGKVTYYKPEFQQGLLQFVTGLKPNTLYRLTAKTTGRLVLNGYQDTTSNKVESDFLTFINDVNGSVEFKTGSTTNIISIAFVGFEDSPPILKLSNLKLEEVVV